MGYCILVFGGWVLYGCMGVCMGVWVYGYMYGYVYK